MDRRAELIEQYHAFLCKAANVAVAHPQGRLSGDWDDWYQEAAIALLEAAERFDPARGVKFLSYAGKCVSLALRRIARDRGHVHVPHVTPAKYTAQAEAAFAPVLPLHGHDGRLNPHADRPAPETPQGSLGPDQVARLMSVLDRRSAKVIQRRYGLDGRRPGKLREVADEMKISVERVRQIEKRALERLETVAVLL